MKAARPPPDVAALPVTFTVGTHAVVVAPRDRCWSVSVDGTPAASTFGTQAEAWEAGVREADRLDRLVAG
jgi:hypothetical protein